MKGSRNANRKGPRRFPSGDRNNGGHPRPRQNGSSGNAQRNYERYLALAREAALSGDTIEMENCYQHAEHYFRVMRGTN
jgi:hypothetical protein